MPVHHIVLLKFKEGVTDAQISELSENLNKLEELDMVTRVTCGLNYCDRSKGYNYALSVTCPTKEDVASYGAHPTHVSIKDTYIVPLVTDVMAVDYVY